VYYIVLPFNAAGGTIDITECPRVVPTPFPVPSVVLSSQMGVPGGYATLDTTGNIPTDQLGNVTAGGGTQYMPLTGGVFSGATTYATSLSPTAVLDSIQLTSTDNFPRYVELANAQYQYTSPFVPAVWGGHDSGDSGAGTDFQWGYEGLSDTAWMFLWSFPRTHMTDGSGHYVVLYTDTTFPLTGSPTLAVSTTAGLPSSGTLSVSSVYLGSGSITYTSISGSNLVGCSSAGLTSPTDTSARRAVQLSDAWAVPIWWIQSPPSGGGQMVMLDGSSSAPAYSFNDLNSGFYQPATGQVGITAGGTAVLNAASTGVTASGLFTVANGLGAAVTGYSATATTTYTETLVKCTANTFTLTLGATSFTAGQLQLVLNTGTGTITVAAASGSVKGVTSLPTLTSAIYMWDGTNWQTAASYGVSTPSGSVGGDLSGTLPDPTVAKIQGVAVTSAHATLLSEMNNATTHSASATANAGEESIFTGSTAAQTITLPGSTAQVSSINTLVNLASVSVTYAAGSGTTINNEGLTGSITVQPYGMVQVILIGTVWYVMDSNQSRTVKRVYTLSGPGATPTYNTNNYDVVHLTALATAITSMTTNLSGTANDGDMLRFSFTDNGTARAITWGASFESSGNVALPTTTVISTRLDVGFFWNTETSKWRCVAVA
jgi:hypothetical protein